MVDETAGAESGEEPRGGFVVDARGTGERERAEEAQRSNDHLQLGSSSAAVVTARVRTRRRREPGDLSEMGGIPETGGSSSDESSAPGGKHRQLAGDIVV